MVKRTPPESAIKKAIVQWLELRPHTVVLPIATTGIWDPMRGVFRKGTNKCGTPDLLVCVRGKFLAIEVKSETGKVSEAQAHMLEEISEAGGLALIAKSLSDVQVFCQTHGL